MEAEKDGEKLGSIGRTGKDTLEKGNAGKKEDIMLKKDFPNTFDVQGIDPKKGGSRLG